MGQVCAAKAMNLAIEKAKRFGVAVVGVKNSNHFGTAAYYGIMATERLMIGFSITNASPRIAPWGGKEPLLGNNPLSFAFPTDRGYPIVLDMSNSVVAAGKIRAAALKGEQIPEGWATDIDGNPTQNPNEALKGLFLPIGGHKGYGLILVVDILSGILTGSGFANMIRRIDDTDNTQHVGHLLGAIDIGHFIPVQEFLDRIGTLIDLVKNSARAKATDEVFLPGEREYRTSQERSKDGIPLQKKVVESLNLMALQLGQNAKLTV
jgi:LDH2 family malate/lactate/ureidoglycolate dehydrogenase